MVEQQVKAGTMSECAFLKEIQELNNNPSLCLSRHDHERPQIVARRMLPNRDGHAFHERLVPVGVIHGQSDDDS